MTRRSEKKRATYCNPFGLNSKSNGGCLLAPMQPQPDMLPYLVETGNSTVYTHNGLPEKSESEYEVRIINPQQNQLYYTWVVTGNATIQTPYDIYSKKITVITSSIADEAFSVTCTVASTIRSEDATGDYTHLRLVGSFSVEATDIIELQAGTCIFDTGDLCKAIGIYSITQQYGTLIEWTASHGELISGQGTTEIQVETRRMLHGMPAVRSCYGLVVVCMLLLC